MYSFIRQYDDFFVISLKVIPKAKKNEIIGILDNMLKIKIASPPIEGKANSQIINFFSDYLNISKSKLEIISGEKSKCKHLKVKSSFEIYKEKFIYLINHYNDITH